MPRIKMRLLVSRKFAAITVDMDHETDYARVYGQAADSVKSEHLYRESIPRILSLLHELKIKATFFIIGRDLLSPFRLRMTAQILAEGHELANHSYSHHARFHRLSREEKRREIQETHRIVLKKLKYRMVGFRAPGYNIDKETIEILEELGYHYDSSVHPTLFHPLLRLSLFLKTRQGPSLDTMGSAMIMFAPTQPYRCSPTRFPFPSRYSHFLEFPIAVLPFFHLPTFGTVDLAMGKSYERLTMPLRRKTNFLTYEIHGIDLINKPSGSFSWFQTHPGMQRGVAERYAIYREIFHNLSASFTVLPLRDCLRHLKGSGGKQQT